MKIARVALEVPVPKLFDYAAPEALGVEVGDRVVVPFGSRRRIGVVVEQAATSEVPAAQLKAVIAPRDDAPRLPEAWVAYIGQLAAYYQRPPGETILASLPPRLRALAPLPRAPRRYFVLTSRAPAPATQRPGAKRRLLEALSGAASPLAETALVEHAGGATPERARAVLRALLNAGWIEPATPAPGARFCPGPELSAAQTEARERIAAALGGFRVFLLHGVTGSGKTEVYLHLVARVLARGAQALVLVPEIGLTPQLEARFRRAFPEARIAVLHSALADAERTADWLAAARGEAGIVLGTRLAVLAPLPRLALVVVDEEHDTSYKQHEGMRYSGRDAAVLRGKLAGCPVVLGSATPSLETWQNARTGRYVRVALPERATPGAQLPQVRMIDLAGAPATHGLSAPLVAAIGERLARGEQSLVFINRRGYAPVLACPACGWSAGCTRCTSRLVLHAADRRLRCHHCGAESPLPRACPTCGNVDVRALGRGTQRVEETLTGVFPAARVLRIDRDSARRRGALARSLEAVHRNEADILVGTQLLAKGHDFPNLTLVGVLDADGALLSTDYRAPERLYATLAQVAGRAGRRAQAGEVLIQTRYPAHPLFAALASHDFAGFADGQLEERRRAGFPPFVYEAALRAEAPRLETALDFLREAAQAPAPPGLRLYDPVPHVVTRRAGLERAQLIVQSASRPALQAFLAAWSERLQAARRAGLRWHLDVDPIEFD